MKPEHRILILTHPKLNVFHVVLFFAHMIEKCNLIKRDKDEVNDDFVYWG